MTQAGENRVDVVECVVFVQPERTDFVFKSEQFGNLPGRLFFDEYAVFAVSLFEPAGDVAAVERRIVFNAEHVQVVADDFAVGNAVVVGLPGVRIAGQSAGKSFETGIGFGKGDAFLCQQFVGDAGQVDKIIGQLGRKPRFNVEVEFFRHA